MTEENEYEYSLALLSADREPAEGGVEIVRMHTNAGTIDCRLHYAIPTDPERAAGVVWVGGAGGGLAGPAGGMYPRLASTLIGDGVTSLRVDYRHPNELIPCALDTLMGVVYLQSLGIERVILVGHSFGGAVVITTGVQSEAVISVITLASQNAGTEAAEDLSPRALFCLHGTADTVLPYACSRDIYQRAGEPKRLEIYPGCGHSFEQCIALVDRDVLSWIRDLIAGPSI